MELDECLRATDADVPCVEARLSAASGHGSAGNVDCLRTCDRVICTLRLDKNTGQRVANSFYGSP